VSNRWCTGCRGTGVIRTLIEPRIENGRVVTMWNAPCGCGQIDIEDLGPSLARSREVAI